MSLNILCLKSLTSSNAVLSELFTETPEEPDEKNLLLFLVKSNSGSYLERLSNLCSGAGFNNAMYINTNTKPPTNNAKRMFKLITFLPSTIVTLNDSVD